MDGIRLVRRIFFFLLLLGAMGVEAGTKVVVTPGGMSVNLCATEGGRVCNWTLFDERGAVQRPKLADIATCGFDGRTGTYSGAFRGRKASWNGTAFADKGRWFCIAKNGTRLGLSSDPKKVKIVWRSSSGGRAAEVRREADGSLVYGHYQDPRFERTADGNYRLTVFSNKLPMGSVSGMRSIGVGETQLRYVSRFAGWNSGAQGQFALSGNESPGRKNPLWRNGSRKAVAWQERMVSWNANGFGSFVFSGGSIPNPDLGQIKSVQGSDELTLTLDRLVTGPGLRIAQDAEHGWLWIGVGDSYETPLLSYSAQEGFGVRFNTDKLVMLSEPVDPTQAVFVLLSTDYKVIASAPLRQDDTGRWLAVIPTDKLPSQKTVRPALQKTDGTFAYFWATWEVSGLAHSALDGFFDYEGGNSNPNPPPATSPNAAYNPADGSVVFNFGGPNLVGYSGVVPWNGSPSDVSQICLSYVGGPECVPGEVIVGSDGKVSIKIVPPANTPFDVKVSTTTSGVQKLDGQWWQGKLDGFTLDADWRFIVGNPPNPAPSPNASYDAGSGSVMFNFDGPNLLGYSGEMPWSGDPTTVKGICLWYVQTLIRSCAGAGVVVGTDGKVSVRAVPSPGAPFEVEIHTEGSGIQRLVGQWWQGKLDGFALDADWKFVAGSPSTPAPSPEITFDEAAGKVCIKLHSHELVDMWPAGHAASEVESFVVRGPRLGWWERYLAPLTEGADGLESCVAFLPHNSDKILPSLTLKGVTGESRYLYLGSRFRLGAGLSRTDDGFLAWNNYRPWEVEAVKPSGAFEVRFRMNAFAGFVTADGDWLLTTDIPTICLDWGDSVWGSTSCAPEKTLTVSQDADGNSVASTQLPPELLVGGTGFTLHAIYDSDGDGQKEVYWFAPTLFQLFGLEVDASGNMMFHI
jgi:hypothetical protein